MKRLNMENWRIKVLRSDRNEVRYHVFSGLLTVLYKDRPGLDLMYQWAKTHNKAALLAIRDEYHKRKIQGA